MAAGERDGAAAGINQKKAASQQSRESQSAARLFYGEGFCLEERRKSSLKEKKSEDPM
ncbi:hypothetical protein M9458_029783, partial [Cirrhinus mrigala]